VKYNKILFSIPMKIEGRNDLMNIPLSAEGRKIRA
jgi:hypothetical protein